MHGFTAALSRQSSSLFHGNKTYFAIAIYSVVFIYLNLHLYIYFDINVVAICKNVTGERKNGGKKLLALCW